MMTAEECNDKPCGESDTATSPETVERWDIEPDGSAWPHAEGDYVRYEDYAALSAALEAGKVERGTLIQALKDGGEIQRIAIARAEAAEAALEAEKRHKLTLMRDRKPLAKQS